MVKKHTVVTFTCDLCGTAYSSVGEAANCQESGLPAALPFQKGDEIKLRNRGGRTYTVAAFLSAKIGFGASGHEWMITLDRNVCLDHKWETSLDVVPALYLVRDEDVASMQRKDNDHGG